MGKAVLPVAYQFTQADIDAGLANNLPKGTSVIVVDANAQPVDIKVAQGGGAPPADSSGIKNNFAATTAPTASDDSGDGYSVGSRIIDTIGDESYICLDATLGSAVWSKTTVGTIAEVAGLQSAMDLKADGVDLSAIAMTLKPEVTMSAGYPTLTVARTFSNSLIDFAITNITASSFKTVTLGGSNALNNTAALIANTINTSVANEMTCWVGAFADSITKALKLKFTATAGVVSITILQANHFATNVLTDPAWTISGGNPAPSSTQGIATSDATASYGLKNLVLVFNNATATPSSIDTIAPLGTTTPVMDGVAAVGTGTTSARADHVHGSDTTKAGTAVVTTSVNGLMSSTDKTKLDGVATGANVNVQSDWNAASGDALILNKPTIPAAVTVNNTLTSTSTTEALSAAQGKVLQDGKAAATHSHAQSEITGLTTDLAGKQETLSSGNNVKTLNGSSILGAGNIAIAADLPGGTVSTATDDGLASGNATIDRVTVTGQTILKYETTGTSTFKVPIGVTSVQVLVVAGGAGGGSGVGGDLRGGGGGAGGLISDAAFVVTAGASLAITVGAGGAAAANGIDSVFSTLTADGGGRGGSGAQTGFAGGSGGGGGAPSGGAATFAGGTGVVGEGNNGGIGGTDGTSYRTGGGGGGAGAVGGIASAGGIGGAGIASTITGTSVTYAGGGGGGGPVAANGGSGGGGRGGAYSAGAATAGSPNTGGGGGGGANTVTGAAGGSGIVIVRFATQSRSYQALQGFASNAAALAGNLLIGQFYNNTTIGGIAQVI